MRWFAQLADVPGISYESSSKIARNELPGHDWVPEERKYGFSGEQDRTIMWPTADGGSTSASPAKQRVFSSREAGSPSEELRWLEETLELPGELSDYHFAIQNACERIFKGRGEEPQLLEKVERLCWLDVSLVETHSHVVEHEPGKFFRVLAYERLARLYEGEGYLAEALEIAERGVRLGQEELSPVAERLRAELAELEAEETPQ